MNTSMGAIIRARYRIVSGNHILSGYRRERRRFSASNKAAEPTTVFFPPWFAISARSIAYELAHIGNLDD